MNAVQKELATLRRCDSELAKFFKRMYEEPVRGKLQAEQFRFLSDTSLQEQGAIKERIPMLEDWLAKLKESATNVSQFIERTKQHSEIAELTGELLHIFIERIEVGERAEKYSRTALQEIRIYCRDIGLVDKLPEKPTRECKPADTVIAMMVPQEKPTSAQAQSETGIKKSGQHRNAARSL